MTLDYMLAASALLAQDPSFEHKKISEAVHEVAHLLQDFYTDGAADRMSVADYARYWLSSGRGNLRELPDPVHHGDVFSRIEASNEGAV